MDSEIMGTEMLEGDEPIECSLVDLIVAAADESDDAWEIGDRVGSLLESERVSLAPIEELGAGAAFKRGDRATDIDQTSV